MLSSSLLHGEIQTRILLKHSSCSNQGGVSFFKKSDNQETGIQVYFNGRGKYFTLDSTTQGRQGCHGSSSPSPVNSEMMYSQQAHVPGHRCTPHICTYTHYTHTHIYTSPDRPQRDTQSTHMNTDSTNGLILPLSLTELGGGPAVKIHIYTHGSLQQLSSNTDR